MLGSQYGLLQELVQASNTWREAAQEAGVSLTTLSVRMPDGRSLTLSYDEHAGSDDSTGQTFGDWIVNTTQ